MEKKHWSPCCGAKSRSPSLDSDRSRDHLRVYTDLNGGPLLDNDSCVVDPVLMAEGVNLAAAIAGAEGGEVTEAVEAAVLDFSY